MILGKKFFLIIGVCLCISACTGNNAEIEGEVDVTQENQEIIQIFALGDSLTAGYGLELHESYPAKLQKLLDDSTASYQVINAGVSGNTSQELLSRIDWTLEDARDGDIGLLVIGGNDGLRAMSVDTMRANIEAIIQKLQEKNMKIVLGGMQIPPNISRAYTRDFQETYHSLAKKYGDIYFLEFFLEGVAADRRYNLADGIHPNSEGYDIIAKNMYQFLLDKKIIGLQ